MYLQKMDKHIHVHVYGVTPFRSVPLFVKVQQQSKKQIKYTRRTVTRCGYSRLTCITVCTALTQYTDRDMRIVVYHTMYTHNPLRYAGCFISGGPCPRHTC